MFEIIIDRDSVCMADDIDAHKKIIEIKPTYRLSDLIDLVINSRYLPYIYGGKSTWVMKRKNKLLAVIGLTNYGPKAANVKTLFFVNNLKLTELFEYDDDRKIGFGYFAQEDYNIVYKRLK